MFFHIWPFKVIFPWERGLLIVAGKWLFPLGPGIWCRVPLLMFFECENVRETPFDCVHQYGPSEDGTTVGVSCNGVYTIENLLTLYLAIGDNDEEEWLTTTAVGIMTEVLNETAWDDLTEDVIEQEVAVRLRIAAGKIGLGIEQLNVTHLAELEPYYVVLDGAGSEIDIS
jgi:hypothetical protein